METHSITRISKTKTIVQCCLITSLIAIIVGFAGKVNLHEFVNNLLAWNTI